MTKDETQSSEETWIKQILPHTLLGRSLLIVVTPLVLVQLVTAFIFYESHWDKVSRRLASGLAGDVGVIINLTRDLPQTEAGRQILLRAASRMELTLSTEKGAILSAKTLSDDRATQALANSLRVSIGKPFDIDTDTLKRDIIIRVQLPDGVLQMVTTRKRLFSSTTYIFVLWMVGASLIMLGVAMVFMRNQVKPIRRLATAADDLGKGRDVPSFKPEGANEVRQAATAFLAMRDRIVRQVSQRTEMLAGVSHDLRTPLTRMKLQLEMQKDKPGNEDMKEDIADMERMLDGYLAFARGEGTETPEQTALNDVLEEVAGQARRKGGQVDLHTEGDIALALRPNTFKRCLTNLVDNAIRYASHVSIRAGYRGDAVEIIIDDDGPGIPAEKRDEVFKPFFRLEGSRNQGTGGVGLGLTIALDVVRGHGGDIELSEAPSGGLRVRLVMPI